MRHIYIGVVMHMALTVTPSPWVHRMDEIWTCMLNHVMMRVN